MKQSRTGGDGLSRRNFLGVSGAALAGASLAAAPRVGAAVDTSPKKVRIGVVGGNFGRSFQWHEHPDCEVVAVSDLIEERKKALMERYSCEKSYPSLEEMIKDPNVDAIALFTAPPDHVRHTVACMKAGKHVISAVPACWSHNWREECEELIAIVEETGLKYMMAETTYWHQCLITARKWLEEGRFGKIFYSESEYLHPVDMRRTREQYGVRDWGFGSPPIWYITHTSAHLIGLTGERLTSVMCTGHGEPQFPSATNIYNNPFYMEQAMFTTDRNNTFRALRGRGGAIGHCDRASWYGEKMSYFMRNKQGLPLEKPLTITQTTQQAADDAGFAYAYPKVEEIDVINWWETDLLPEPLRHDSGHQGSHTFITHEFIDAIVHDRRPAVDVYEAVAYSVPGFVAHESALEGGVCKPIPQFDPT